MKATSDHGLTIVFVAFFYSVAASKQTFRLINDSRCISDNVTALRNVSDLTKDRQCAVKCLAETNCYLFMINSKTKSCLLFPAVAYFQYLAVTYYAPNSCKIWYSAWIPYAVFATSGQYVVPPGVTNLRVLAVGGGAGAGHGDCGGGGSGYVAFANISVTSGQTFNVSIGVGGDQFATGGRTTFGSDLLVALGGYSTTYYNGGAGGSGGGGGFASASGQLSGNGGSAGGNGGTSGSGKLGGSGQGSSFTAYFGQFRYSVISAGSGAAGVPGNATYHVGGGGGGGVLVNGTGPSSIPGQCCMASGTPNCGPGPATGYGAGGSASCWLSTSSSGGSGASGVVYIEYS